VIKRIGGTLLVLGVGSFILPLFGMQFRLLNIFGDAQPLVGLALATIGAILLIAGFIFKSSGKQRSPAQTPMPPVNAPAVSQVNSRARVPAYPVPVVQQQTRCERCGGGVEPGDKFCGDCAAPVFRAAPEVYRCLNPSCGTLIKPGKQFCGACGARSA
jgi:hypothetical protein